MKENLDPHQVVISREYFDTLVLMARCNDFLAGRITHPGQTMVDRILWHARKYNPALHKERQEELCAELIQKRMWRNRRAQLIKEYTVTKKHVYVMDGKNDWPAVVCGESRRGKMLVRLMVMFANAYSFEHVHIDNIILSPRP
jgi:hypothetical protein